MLVKSIMGYALAGITLAWIVISKFINEKYDIVKHPTAWRVGQWFTTEKQHGILGCRMTCANSCLFT